MSETKPKRPAGSVRNVRIPLRGSDGHSDSDTHPRQEVIRIADLIEHACPVGAVERDTAQLIANVCHYASRDTLADGCRDPLVLWGDVLIDGHNRYSICTKHGL